MLQRSRGNKYCRFGHRGKLREGDLEENNNSSLPLLRLPPFHTIFQLEKKVRLDAAQTEAAWKGAGKEVGLHVWRVEQFKIKAWPKQQYGTFYSGDSFIVLNTWKKPDAPTLYHDIHFWLGLETTQDEAGTAAYKTVELDDFLGTLPVQHREVMGSESPLFLSYFPHFKVEHGGVESGFNHVKPEEYRTRLLKIRIEKSASSRFTPDHKPTSTIMREVPLSFKSLNSGDVFICDAGLVVYQWNGSKASGAEKLKAGQICREIDGDRKGLAKVVVYDEGDNDAAAFWTAIGGQGPVSSDDQLPPVSALEQQLMRLSDAAGSLSFSLAGSGSEIKRSLLDSGDVFILDIGTKIFIWIGKSSSKEERLKSMSYAVSYLKQKDRPLETSITRVIETAETNDFLDCFS